MAAWRRCFWCLKRYNARYNHSCRRAEWQARARANHAKLRSRPDVIFIGPANTLYQDDIDYGIIASDNQTAEDLGTGQAHNRGKNGHS